MSAYAWLIDLCDSLWNTEDHDTANAIADLSGAANSGDFETAERLYGVVMAYSGLWHLPWLDLYARHMRLQTYLRAGRDLTALESDIAETLDFAKAENVRKCPQAVCAVSDLSLWYGAVDAPGYASRRLLLIDSILTQLAPSVECFSCFMAQKMDALISRSDLKAARAVGDLWIKEIDRTGGGWNTLIAEYPAKLKPFIDLQLHSDPVGAQDLLDRFHPDCEADHIWKALATARLLLATGRSGQAAHQLPPREVILREGGRLQIEWFRLSCALDRTIPGINTSELRSAGDEICQAAIRDGRRRDAVESALLSCSLYLSHDDLKTAQGLLATAVSLAERLYFKESVMAEIDRLRAILSNRP